MKRLKRDIGVVGALALVLSMTMLSVTPGTAGANHTALDPGCGTVLKPTVANTTFVLSANIGPCQGHGLIVDPAAVTPFTIDLNNKRIIGDGPAADLQTNPQGDAGILVKAGNVTVKNGTVQLFNAGIVLEGVDDNTLTGLTVSENVVVGLNGVNVTDFGEGIQLLNSSDNVIRNNTITGNVGWSGMTLLGNSDNNVIGNDGVANGTDTNRINKNDQPEGVFARQTSGLRLENLGTACPNGNIVDGNQMEENGNDGIQLFSCANGNVFVNNKAEKNGRNGFHTFANANGNFIGVKADGITAGGNEFKENGRASLGDGISLGGSSNTVKNNLVEDNNDDGIVLAFCRQNLPHQPIRCQTGGDNNTVSNNTVRNNGTGLTELDTDDGTPTDRPHGSGIKAQQDNLLPTASGAEGNTISNNAVSGSAEWDLEDQWNDGCVGATKNTWSNNTLHTKQSPSCLT